MIELERRLFLAISSLFLLVYGVYTGKLINLLENLSTLD